MFRLGKDHFSQANTRLCATLNSETTEQVVGVLHIAMICSRSGFIVELAQIPKVVVH
jgi:hypothetical protein